jgi:aquaporin Z
LALNAVRPDSYTETTFEFSTGRRRMLLLADWGALHPSARLVFASVGRLIQDRSDMNTRELGAEFIGTLGLVLGGCGAAVLAAVVQLGDGAENGLGLGYLGVSLAFGLTVLTGVYALGHISGGHFNPAVTLGLVAGGRFPASKAAAYIVAQVVGAFVAAGLIYAIASGQTGFDIDSNTAGAFAANGYGDLSPGGYGMGAAFLTEVVMTAMFLIVIMGATAKKAAPGFAGLAIGLMLTLIHLISIPVTNTSVNPARSTSQAIFAGGDYLPQLWLFWVAPIIGGILGALIYRYVLNQDEDLVPA